MGKMFLGVFGVRVEIYWGRDIRVWVNYLVLVGWRREDVCVIRSKGMEVVNGLLIGIVK